MCSTRGFDTLHKNKVKMIKEVLTEEEKLARSKRVRKKSQGQYYSDFKRIDPRGKSSLEKTKMIKDLQRNLKYQLIRIDKLKYVIQKIKELGQYKASLKQSKIRRRDANLEKSKEEIHELEKQIRARERQIGRLIGKLDEKVSTISALEKEIQDEHKPTYLLEQLNKYKALYDLYYGKYRKVLQRKRYKPVAKVIVKKEELTGEEKRVKRMAEKAVTDKMIINSEILVRYGSFSRANKLSIAQLTVLSKAELYKQLYSSDVNVSSTVLNRLEESGYLTSSNLGAISNKKYWYLTTKGKDLLDRLHKYIQGNEKNSRRNT